MKDQLRDTGSKLAQKEIDSDGLAAAKRDLENQIKRITAERDLKDDDHRREQEFNKNSVVTHS